MRKTIHAIALCLPFLFAVSCRESPAERCQREAEENNKTCPIRIDGQTILDSLRFDAPSMTFTYHYTVSGASDSLLSQHIQSKELFENTLRNLTNIAGMQYYLKQNISFRYIYHSPNSQATLGEIHITPQDYN